MSSGMSIIRLAPGAGLGITHRRPMNRSTLQGTQHQDSERCNRTVTALSKGHCVSRRSVGPARSGKVQALSDEAVAIVDASAPAPDDPVIGVMFTLAVVALSVLTLGVGYLSISSWLDSRQEEEDRRKGGFGPSRGSMSDSESFNTSAFTSDDRSKRSKKKKSPKKKSDKGFGN